MMLQNNKNSKCFKYFSCTVMLIIEKFTLSELVCHFPTDSNVVIKEHAIK